MRQGLRFQPVLLLAALLLYPLFVADGGLGRHLPHPGAMGGFREVDRDVQSPGKHRQTAHVVRMLVRD